MFHKGIDWETWTLRIIIGVLVITLVGGIGFLIWDTLNTDFVDTPVQGVVIRHTYEPPQVHFYTSSSKNGSTIHTWTTPAKYKIVARYKNLNREFENKNLYNCLQDGESINLVLVRTYRKGTHEFINEYIRLPY